MKPYHKNPRQITRKQMDNLSTWLAELGDLSGIVHDLNTDEIIGGNQRGMVFDVNKCKVELIDGPHEPDEQGTVAHGFIVWKGARYAYRQVRWDDKQAEKANIVANKAGGGWDFDTLANEFEVSDLIEWGFDAAELGIDLTGGTDDDAEPQIDRAEELREQWGVEPGQMWRLPSRTPGQEHRLICGDCTDAAVVERVMGEEKADMVLTDPPYNVSYQANESKESLRARNRRTDGLVIENDFMDDADFDAFLDSALKTFPLKGGGVYYLCAPPGRTETQFRNALDRGNGLSLRQCIVWVKDRFVFGRQDYHWRHESILYGWRDGDAHYFVDDRTQDTVWEIERVSVSEYHPTMKPVSLFEKAIGNSSQTAQFVYDPFSGSGTTIIAAENLSRQCRAVEISPAYVAVALQRYVDAFGIEPELAP